MVLLNMRDI